MKFSWIDVFCLEQAGCEKDYQTDWEACRYMLKGKMFAMRGTDNEGRDILTLKLEPEIGTLLREQYDDIRPGYYMNKTHWSSVDLNGSVPDEVLKSMICDSHRLILNSLSKKLQREISGN